MKNEQLPVNDNFEIHKIQPNELTLEEFRVIVAPITKEAKGLRDKITRLRSMMLKEVGSSGPLMKMQFDLGRAISASNDISWFIRPVDGLMAGKEEHFEELRVCLEDLVLLSGQIGDLPAMIADVTIREYRRVTA